MPDTTDQSEQNESPSLLLYRVPLEHFPSIENYYPERIVSSFDEIESVADVKPSKNATALAKKGSAPVEVDKTSVLFDEKIKEMFRTR